VNPPRIKRQFRDPHADWWDKQERRNFGEPVHEDHDIMGLFSPYEYTWVNTRQGLFQIGVFVALFTGMVMSVKLWYPEKPAYPREFEGGLERELGGPGAVRVSSCPQLVRLLSMSCTMLILRYRQGLPGTQHRGR
jgi:NADH dehydrogenase (ubiquinone) 1 beta subcomplex subunit 8